MVVGGRIAGGNAAATLREEGFRGRVVIISREPGVPFGRAPLSYLRSEEDLEGWYVRPARWYEEHDVELLPSPARLNALRPRSATTELPPRAGDAECRVRR